MNRWNIIAPISAIIPIILIKEYTISKNVLLLIGSLICYLVLLYSYINIFKDSKVSSTYTIIQVVQILIVLVAGVLFFKEKITISMLLGILLAIGAILLLKK